MEKKCIFILAFFIFFSAVTAYAAEKDSFNASIAIFTLQHTNLQLNALSQKSTQTIADTFYRMGRFMPVDEFLTQQAMQKTMTSADEDAFRKTALLLNADLYAVVTIITMGNIIIGTVKIIPLSEQYKLLEQTITVRGQVLSNIPLKLAREIAFIHRGIPVDANIIGQSDGLHLLNAGQWQGLSPGSYKTSSGETISIRTTSRYTCLAALPESLKSAKHVSIASYPSPQAVIREINKRIEINTNYRHSLANTGAKAINPEKKFFEGIFLINPVANAFLPGYGSYLSTSYLGFKNTTASIPGILFSTALIITHFILPDCMTAFKINFLPGVMDKDKTRQMNNLQIFLWATIPVTISVAYLDQLAYQFTAASVVPPFFLNKNEAALALSLVIPGGGLYYKGYRLPGWGFYLSEMSLAGLCVYAKDDKKKVMSAGIALAGVKLIELITAYFCKPSYNFYNIEKEGRISPPALSMGIDTSESGGLVYKLGVSVKY